MTLADRPLSPPEDPCPHCRRFDCVCGDEHAQPFALDAVPDDTREWAHDLASEALTRAKENPYIALQWIQHDWRTKPSRFEQEIKECAVAILRATMSQAERDFADGITPTDLRNVA